MGERSGIAFRLRARRRQRALTLDQLAAASGLTKGHLSRLERGEKAPSLAAIMRLAHALDTSVSYLFGETGEEDTILIRRAVQKLVVQPTDHTPGYAVLSQGVSSNQAEVFLMTPPAAFAKQQHATHGGEEFFFILNGSVDIEFPGRIVALEAGDTVQFPGHVGHRVRGRSENASVLIVIAGR